MKYEFGSPMSATATNATSSVATVSGISSKTHFITDISGSSDKAGSLLLVKDGTTVIWQVQLGTTAAGGMSFQHTFSTPLRATVSADISITVDGTAACYSNIAGFTL
jgi:hypothetical protein